MLSLIRKLKDIPNLVQEEFLKVEDHLIKREESAAKRFGLQERLKKGTVKNVKLLMFFFKTGLSGFILLYMMKAAFFKRFRIYLAEYRMIYSDHTNRMIRNKILKPCNINFCDDTRYHTCSILDFLRFKNILYIGSSFRRNHCPGPTSFNALSDFWLYYFAYRCFFSKSDLSTFIVVDDFGSSRMAMLFAAKHEGLKLALVRMSAMKGKQCPVDHLDVLFGWNKLQADEIYGVWRYFSQFSEKSKSMMIPDQNTDKKIVVGIAVTNFFSTDGLSQLINELTSQDWIGQIIVIPHPGTKNMNLFNKLNKVVIEPPGASRDIFFDKIDFLIAGNTSVIEKSLYSGKPVVYDCVLDKDINYNSKYTANSLLLDNSHGLYSIDLLNRIENFYCHKEWHSTWQAWRAPDERSITVEDAIKYLKSQ
jgi:hypothetical protein